MKVSDYDYQLPAELIAQYPTAQRTDSRLLKVSSIDRFDDLFILDMLTQLHAGDLLVLNNTKVIPARLFGRKQTGGQVEVLLERVISQQQFIAQIRASKSPKPGQILHVDGDDNTTLTVLGREGAFFKLQINQTEDLFDWLARVGHMPLPPYIERSDEHDDQTRYQTVFAEQEGAVAAPTAGLHYDQTLLNKLQDKGVNIAYVTLHVGAGTYQPVRVETVEEHQMHSEWVQVTQAVCDAILKTKQQGGRVVAVGTTVVRCLETAAQKASEQCIEAYAGETDIFIYPGFEFKVIDMLQTNFHLPQSTLLMLVSAFAGYDTVKQAYQHAIDQKYRFFSYGDSMLLERSVG